MYSSVVCRGGIILVWVWLALAGMQSMSHDTSRRHDMCPTSSGTKYNCPDYRGPYFGGSFILHWDCNQLS